jgi:hypothetical protein
LFFIVFSVDDSIDRMIRRREANQAKPSVPNKAAHIHRESGDAVEAASVIMGGMTGVVVVDRCHKDAHIIMPSSGGKTIELLIFERFGYIYILGERLSDF